MKRPLRAGAAFALGSPRARSPSRPPAPTDLSAEVSGGGPELRLSLRRAGHLVALGDGTTRAAGEDWVAVTLDPRTGNAASPPSLVWETTDLASLATTRGVVRFRPGAGAPVPELVSSAPPAIAARHEGKHHRCEAVHDERGGFVVLCLVDAKARRVAAASPVGARALEDVWIGPSRPGRPTLVRLDLPVVRGGAAARLVGYVDGATAVAVRAEASWLFGEPSAKLFLGALSKVQPQVR